MQPLRWYINRVSLMSPGEIAWRATQSVSGRIEKSLPAPSAPAASAGAARLPPWPAPAGVPEAEYLAAADAVLSGTIDLFGDPVRVGFPDAGWNRDPVSGRQAPLTFGKSIDYRDATLVGSARNIWEVNRHFQLVTLAQAWAVSRSPRYREAARELLRSWLEACPYPRGVNWTSALEHGIRLINWYIAARLLQLTGSSGDDAPPAGWLDSIYHHCRFIERNRSRYSSANNHLIGEAAGLFVAACAWPCWPRSARWRAKAKRLLEREAVRQVHEDGVTREQTVGYQIFVLHLLIAAGLAGEAHGEPFSRAYWSTVRGMITFLRSIADAGGHLPDFGDRDDGMALVLSPRARARALADLLDLEQAWSGTARELPGNSAAAWLSRGFPAPAAWPAGPAGTRRAFPSGGYFVLGGHFAGPDEVKLVLDAAPLGYLAIAAHGHADCLSFTFSVGGHPVLIDPGTFCYHDDPVWRDYFRGTAAHNTVRVDGQDQSVSGGPFMWLRKARPAVESRELEAEVQRIRASHDGYGRLADPVTHVREIRLGLRERAVEIADTLRCAAGHAVERFWHFAPECTVERPDGGMLVIRTPSARVELVCTDGEVELLRGSDSPRGGWMSDRFGSRRETTTAVVRNRIQGTTRLETLIRWSPR